MTGGMSLIEVTVTVTGEVIRRATLPALPREGDKVILLGHPRVYRVASVKWWEIAEGQWEVRVDLQ